MVGWRWMWQSDQHSQSLLISQLMSCLFVQRAHIISNSIYLKYPFIVCFLSFLFLLLNLISFPPSICFITCAFSFLPFLLWLCQSYHINQFLSSFLTCFVCSFPPLTSPLPVIYKVHPWFFCLFHSCFYHLLFQCRLGQRHYVFVCLSIPWRLYVGNPLSNLAQMSTWTGGWTD